MTAEPTERTLGTGGGLALPAWIPVDRTRQHLEPSQAPSTEAAAGRAATPPAGGTPPPRHPDSPILILPATASRRKHPPAQPREGASPQTRLLRGGRGPACARTARTRTPRLPPRHLHKQGAKHPRAHAPGTRRHRRADPHKGWRARGHTQQPRAGTSSPSPAPLPGPSQRRVGCACPRRPALRCGVPRAPRPALPRPAHLAQVRALAGPATHLSRALRGRPCACLLRLRGPRSRARRHISRSRGTGLGVRGGGRARAASVSLFSRAQHRRH